MHATMGRAGEVLQVELEIEILPVLHIFIVHLAEGRPKFGENIKIGSKVRL
jgi:hypothetical protein